MHFDDGAVERDRFHLDPDHLFLLEPHENPVKDTVFAPSVHAGVNTMPIAKFFGETSPLTPMFCNIQNRVENKKIVEIDITSLTWKAVSYSFVLFTGYLHKPTITQILKSDN